MEVSEFMIGKAGEHLVVSDLILKNKNSFLAGEGLPYDVVCESNGRLIKIQVKTCIAPRMDKELYVYSLQNGKSKNRKQYQENEIDMFALVALDSKEIAYINIKDAKSIIEIRPTEKIGTYKSDFDTEKRNKIYKLVDSGETFANIARLLDMHPSNVRAIFINRHNEDKIVSTRGKYFKDFTFNGAEQSFKRN